MDEKGQRLKSPSELANTWNRFLGSKFAQTDLERMRKEYEELPDRGSEEDAMMTREEFNMAVKKMKKNKATGMDGVPAEVWQCSAVANEKLFQFLQAIWTKEEVPPELVVGIFVMIFKKNDPDDCANYRCIGLLNHGYKIMSIVLLQRLMTECGKFFSDWQAGFRPQRGCRDNILLLRIIYDQFIKGDSRFVVTYIDFKAAFDSVSHKYLDVALAAA